MNDREAIARRAEMRIIRNRRELLHGLAALAAAPVLAGAAGCGRPSGSSPAPPSRPPRKVLLVFFSRAGENYFHGGRKVLSVGNTEVVAKMIRDVLPCDVFTIQPREPYPHDYEETVRRNTAEQEQEARPAIVDPPTSIDAYDTILMGSPVWNVRAPRIMLTFAERYDFTGKTVYPFTTHAMSGLGHVVDEYAAACRGATLGEALAIRGEEVAERRGDLAAWLRRIGLLAA